MPTQKEHSGNGQKNSGTGSRSGKRAAHTVHQAKGTGAFPNNAGKRSGKAASTGAKRGQALGRPDRYAPNPDVYGSGRGVLTMAPDFDEPLDDFGDLS